MKTYIQFQLKTKILAIINRMKGSRPDRHERMPKLLGARDKYGYTSKPAGLIWN